MRKILFVDRDGTLVKEQVGVQLDRVEKIRLVEGVIPALLQLQQGGFQLVMVSNQEGLGTSSFPQHDFQVVQDFVIDIFKSQGVTFEDTLICPHLPLDNCHCRLPGTGLLTTYLKDHSIDWHRSAMVGDTMSDVELGRNIGVRSYQLNSPGGPWTWKDIYRDLISQPRIGQVSRKTRETEVMVSVNLDGSGETAVNTGIGFFDHMLEQLGKHSNINLSLQLHGDQHVDDHHSVEDAGIAIGEALRQAWSDKVGIGRYGFSLPMDECKAEALIDLSGRAVTKIMIPFTAERIGSLATEMIPHFFESMARAAGMNLHVAVSEGNNHHMAEASFKAVARALGQAVALSDPGRIPTTKGVL